MKFTFKKAPKPTGKLARVAYSETTTDIKLNGRIMGMIIPPNHYRNAWIIQIALKKKKPDDNPNCAWKWQGLTATFEKEEAAREWVKHNLQDIIESNELELHFLED